MIEAQLMAIFEPVKPRHTCMCHSTRRLNHSATEQGIIIDPKMTHTYSYAVTIYVLTTQVLINSFLLPRFGKVHVLAL